MGLWGSIVLGYNFWLGMLENRICGENVHKPRSRCLNLSKLYSLMSVGFIAS